jgi:pimeloyl-ACP methyl ester carboxylesterase
MRRTSAFLALFGAAAAACGSTDGAPPVAPAAKPAPREDGGVDITLTTRDGVKLAATHWAGPAANEHCVVLVHQYGSTREEWAPLIDRLRKEYEILAVDLRGHGGSTRGPGGELSWRTMHEKDWEAAVGDVAAAADWLGERGFRAEDCAYLGSSIGSSLVLLFAAERAPGSGVVLLSPGLAYRGLVIGDAAKRLRGPRMLVTSDEPAPAATADELQRIWGDAAERLVVAGNAHGLAMIVDQDVMLDAVAGFVERSFTSSGERPASAPSATP